MSVGTCVGTMAYAHKHVFSLSREISPGLVHGFSWVSLWNFQEHGVFVCWIQIALYVASKTFKNVKRVCMAGVTCVGTMAYAHKHVFSLSKKIFFLEPPWECHRASLRNTPPLVGHRAYLRDPAVEATGLVLGTPLGRPQGLFTGPPLLGHGAYLQDPLW